MVGSKRWGVVAVVAVLGIALGTLVPPAAQQFSQPSDAVGDPVDAEERCAQTVVDFVAGLQDHIDGVAGMSASGLAEAFAGDALEASSTQFTQRVAALGCDEDDVAEQLTAELRTLEGDGLVGGLVAEVVRAAVMGESPDLPAELTVATTDDIGAVIALAAPGSTLRLEGGEHVAAAPLVLPASLTLEGAGIDDTRIVSTAREAALVQLSASRLRLADLTIAHRGQEPASVVVIHDGSYELTRVRVTGGVADADGAGGAGIVLGPDDHDPAAGAGPPGRQRRLEDVEVDRNAGAGILVRGAEAPEITGARATGNGACGICFLGWSAGSLDRSVVAGNLSGIALGGEADPEVTASTIERNRQAGIVVEDEGRGRFVANDIAGNGAIGVVVNDHAEPFLDDNEIRGHREAAVVFGSESAGTLRDSTMDDNPVGVWLDGDAAPAITGNRIVGGESAGMIFAGAAGGEASDNEVDQIPIGIEVRDSAAPELRANRVTDSEEAALVFRDEGAGLAAANTCAGGDPRIVLLDQADPGLDGNDCRLEDLR